MAEGERQDLGGAAIGFYAGASSADSALEHNETLPFPPRFGGHRARSANARYVLTP